MAKYIKENDIKLLIDLHGCWSFRDFCIELCTGGEWDPNVLWRTDIINKITQSLNESLKSYIHHSNKWITKNTVFKADSETIVSAFVSKECKIPAIQIEINKELRDMNDSKKLTILISTLEDMIQNLIQII